MIETIHPEQIEGFRLMTPAQELRMVADLYEAGIPTQGGGIATHAPGLAA